MVNKPNINDMLEKIVFDEHNLRKLKVALNQFQDGELSIKQLGQTLIALRGEIFEALKTFIPFQLKLVGTNKSVSEFAGRASNSTQIQLELNERNTILETIGTRLNKIFEYLNNGK